MSWVARRARGEALPYITGHVEFMGLDLMIGRECPPVAPHAQHMVELALRASRRQVSGELVAAELATGCGAMALALAALEPRFTRVYALETAPAALEAARANGARYLMNLVINWLDGASLDAVPEPVDVLLCGRIERAASDDAAPALDATQLSASTAQLLAGAHDKLRPGGTLLCAVPRAHQSAIASLLDRTHPTAQLAFEPAPADVVIVTAVGSVPRGQ